MRLADDLPPLLCRNVKKIRGLKLTGTTWATSAYCGMTVTFTEGSCNAVIKIHNCEILSGRSQKHREKILFGQMVSARKFEIWVFRT